MRSRIRHGSAPLASLGTVSAVGTKCERANLGEMRKPPVLTPSDRGGRGSTRDTSSDGVTRNESSTGSLFVKLLSATIRREKKKTGGRKLKKDKVEWLGRTEARADSTQRHNFLSATLYRLETIS